MTSASSASFGTDEHPEVAEISALTEGLLPPERSGDVRAHLSECELCADVRQCLEEIRGALGTLPGPVHMPSDIAGRIDAALAAEALLDATAPDTGRTETSAQPGGPAEEPSGVSRETADSEAVPHQTSPIGKPGDRAVDRPAGRARGASGPGRTAHRSRRRRTALLGAAGAVIVLTVVGLLLPGLRSDPSDTASGERKPPVTPESSQGALTDEVLEARVRSLLADSGAGKPEQGGQPNAAPGASDFTTKASPGSQGTDTFTMPPCIRDGIDRTEAPLAVGMDVYQEQEAYIVVLPHGSDATRVDAYVVEADCVGSASPGPGTVLTTRTYTR